MFVFPDSGFAPRYISGREFKARDAEFSNNKEKADLSILGLANTISDRYNAIKGSSLRKDEDHEALLQVIARPAVNFQEIAGAAEQNLIFTQQANLAETAETVITGKRIYEEELSELAVRLEKAKTEFETTRTRAVSAKIEKLGQEIQELVLLASKGGTLRTVRSATVQQNTLQKALDAEIFSPQPRLNKVQELDYHIMALEFDKRYRNVVDETTLRFINIQTEGDTDNIEKAFWLFAAGSLLAYFTKSELVDFALGFSRFSPRSRDSVLMDMANLLDGSFQYRERAIKELTQVLKKNIQLSSFKLSRLDQAKISLRDAARRSNILQHMFSKYSIGSGNAVRQIDEVALKSGSAHVLLNAIFGVSVEYENATLDYWMSKMFDNSISAKITDLVEQNQKDKMTGVFLSILREKLNKKAESGDKFSDTVLSIVSLYEKQHPANRIEVTPVRKVNREDLLNENKRKQLYKEAIKAVGKIVTIEF